MTLAATERHPEGDVELAIEGMTCAACAARIERRLERLDGVRARVDLAAERARVALTTPVAVEELVATVERLGFGARPVTDDRPPAPADGRVERSLRRRVAVALLLGLPVAHVSMGLAVDPALRFAGSPLVLLTLAAPVVTWCAWPFHRAAVVNLRHGTASMDTLVSLGIIASVAGSIVSGPLYLDVALVVTLFLLVGRLFEAGARRRAGEAVRALAALRPRDAVLRRNGEEVRVPVSWLRAGDEIVARPGEALAADGEVVEGECALDTSVLTGEAAPREAGRGDSVEAGAIVVGGRLVVRVTRAATDSGLARMVQLVERTRTERANAQRLADRICAIFVPAVLALAAATFAGWTIVGGPAFAASLSVLVIACPCALGLATPMALMAATDRGAREGIFLTGHRALEAAHAVDVVVLDKTGTVTTGRMSVVDVAAAPGVDIRDVVRWAAAVENASEHPLAAALVALARESVGTPPPVTGFTSLSGLGARGTVEGATVTVGSARLLDAEGLDPDVVDVAGWERAGRTTVLVGRNGVVVGAFALVDEVKPEAAAAVATLRDLDVRTVLLTGDHKAAARRAAEEIGVDDVVAGVDPDEKAAAIDRLRAAGASVAMVGDGVNDSPALARADLGLAMGSGTDVALGTADMILVRDRLDVVPAALALARATRRTIRRNLAWAFAYNTAALPVAALGLLNPVVAGATMALSSAVVVASSLRLRRP
ncbi:heavy metal translocating P-type ATPase [Actinomycetospora cinnamomea]|uniref:Cation-transporting P-type ATPase A/B/Cu+-exporting ATPase n=1 Tax=Actinomycetospora cinnamomea TaxID=663609 RepID=A0A2U1FIG8_9PSEU|nr:cation-translocating P-type ATPase [Actinomycetospora cinnamomea]PVZ11957.1 cation-transporting P-type ATPase A/B/Cu+-exporting ATPase [Actinomycetospora cinnamomea]